MYSRKKSKKIIAALAFCTAVVLCMLPVFKSAEPLIDGITAYAASSAQEEYEEKIAAAEQKKAELEKQKKDAAKMLENLTQEKESIQAYIEELDKELNDISLAIFELEEDIKETEEELALTRQELEAAKQREADQYDIMKRRIQYMYENGEDSYLDVFIGASSIADILNQVEYMYRITEYDNSLLERYEEAKQAVIDKENYLEASLEELQVLEETKQFEQETVEALMEAKSAEIERYTEQIGITDELLFQYIEEISSQEMEIEEIKEAEQKRLEEEERKRKEEEERLRREAEAAAAAAAGKEVPPQTSGYDPEAINSVVLTDNTQLNKMIWPLPGDYRTYSKFGYRNINVPGASTYHKGWDIGGEFGAPIVAVLAGTVTEVSYNGSSGNYVKIDHGSGVVTAYLHCSKQLVSVGDYVQQGQKIALVGSTGVSSGPHLHFGLAVNGTYIDPDPYLPY